MTNDLVSSNDSCMDLVKEALKFIDCEINIVSLLPQESRLRPLLF